MIFRSPVDQMLSVLCGRHRKTQESFRLLEVDSKSPHCCYDQEADPDSERSTTITEGTSDTDAEITYTIFLYTLLPSHTDRLASVNLSKCGIISAVTIWWHLAKFWSIAWSVRVIFCWSFSSSAFASSSFSAIDRRRSLFAEKTACLKIKKLALLPFAW